MTPPDVRYHPVPVTQMFDWPATPGEDRLKAALLAFTKGDPPGPLTPQAQEDLHWITIFHQLLDHSAAVSAEFAVNPANRESEQAFNLAFAAQSRSLDTADTVGLGIWMTREDQDGRRRTALSFTTLLRDAEWIGLCPYLPLVSGLTAVVRESEHFPGEPGYVLALPALPDPPRRRLMPPPGLAEQLYRVLRSHGVQNCHWTTSTEPS